MESRWIDTWLHPAASQGPIQSRGMEFLLTAPDEAGDYEVVCTVVCSEDHEGMHMKLVVLPKRS
jgi:heme/copper-type cytochrome/quinol oxidase subunit 2